MKKQHFMTICLLQSMLFRTVTEYNNIFNIFYKVQNTYNWNK